MPSVTRSSTKCAASCTIADREDDQKGYDLLTEGAMADRETLAVGYSSYEAVVMPLVRSKCSRIFQVAHVEILPDRQRGIVVEHYLEILVQVAKRAGNAMSRASPGESWRTQDIGAPGTEIVRDRTTSRIG